MYTALSICYKAYGRVHETLPEWSRPLPASSASAPILGLSQRNRGQFVACMPSGYLDTGVCLSAEIPGRY